MSSERVPEAHDPMTKPRSAGFTNKRWMRGIKEAAKHLPQYLPRMGTWSRSTARTLEGAKRSPHGTAFIWLFTDWLWKVFGSKQ